MLANSSFERWLILQTTATINELISPKFPEKKAAKTFPFTFSMEHLLHPIVYMVYRRGAPVYARTPGVSIFGVFVGLRQVFWRRPTRSDEGCSVS